MALIEGIHIQNYRALKDLWAACGTVTISEGAVPDADAGSR
jgi:hypothetical protein